MMDKAAEIQISVGFLDPDLFTSTNISQHSHQVGKAISNAMMNNYYVVGAYYTSHLRTMCGSRTGGWSLPCVMSD
jgi:hypothetical protein